ncbi:probable disease resistance protein At4g27220 [Mangifera indica]|uniref:probable disease resistance protein At4g27220 n=1 Tax=Mangifera indica TaxID=29780 RepID=UPI001CFA6D2C|nr:probable disease resistance protein At4g27220 [Mangifera indica]
MAEEIAISTAAGLASTAAESAYDLLKQPISYVFKHQSYINKLKKQVEDLRNKRETVEKPVESAERQGEEIYKAVKKWLSDVDEFTERVERTIIEDEDKANKGGCFKMGSCPNLIQRYKLGKEAMKATMDGANLLGKGNFSSVSYRPALQKTESMYVRDYETFDSRKQAFQEIMEALQDVNINMIGVYGMGGVGKTTLVKKVAWEAKKNKLFDEVVIAEATQTPDYKRIQEKVASELGLEIRQEGEYQRSGLLRERIKKEKNLLIILDNIWTKLDLDEIGIPFGGVGREKDEKIRPCIKLDLDAVGISFGCVEREKDEKTRPCTILLTSRNRDLLSKDMKTQKDIFIGPLSYGDAWNLFRKIVGDAAESSDFRPVGDKIVKKCGGLPIAISLIANALKNESLHSWEDALAQLQRSNPTHILGMDETLYSTMEVSYKFLKNEEAKSLFLLCALYNAGNSVFIDDLLKYSMGWNLFGDVYTLEEGRNRLHRLIDHLKASCLLEDGTYDNSVKMHDIIHVVAVSIAATEKLMFNIQNVTGLKDVLGGRISKDSTAISLPYKNINDDLPERLEYPKLELFFLFCKNRSPQIADAFFDKMKELRVLSAYGVQFLPLPSSISFLKNLQTLSLKSCTFGNIRILGELSKLAFLSLVGSNIEELPVEIGQLTQLKLLDLSNCLNLKYIATNVISSLSQLEELYMGNSFVQWEVEGVDNQGRRNASLEELKQLSNLTTLHLHIQDARVMPQDLFFKKLKSYKIFIGDKWKWPIKFDLSTSRMLKLKIDVSIHLQHGVKSLLKMTKVLSLEGMSGVRNVIYELSVDGFPHLKHLHVKNDLELLYIINSVVWKLVFPNLESLILGNLIKLENVCHGQLNVGSFRKLRIIKIVKCDRLEYLFAFFIAKSLMQLQEIEVTDCKNLKEIFGEENNDHGDEIETNNQTELNHLCSLKLQRLLKFITISSDMRVAFPSLEKMVLLHLYNLQLIWQKQKVHVDSFCKLKVVRVEFCLKLLSIIPSNTQGHLTFHNLESLKASGCLSMKSLFPVSTATGLVQLKELLIYFCGLEKIVSEEEVNGAPIFLFPQLTDICLFNLQELKCFYPRLHAVEWPMLKFLAVHGCKNINLYASEFPSFQAIDGERQPALFLLEKIGFRNMEYVKLSEFPTLKEKIWNEGLPVGLFCNLKWLVLDEDFGESTAFPIHVFDDLRNLETLEVRNSHSLKHLFDIKGKLLKSSKEEILGFNNLKTLKVHNCSSLRYMFTPIILGLDQLQEIEVKNCALIEEIITKDEGKEGAIDKIFIPHLNSIVLELLPDLTNFYSGTNYLECPSLKSITIANCPKMETFVFFDLKTDHFDRTAPLFSEKVAFPSLEKMVLLHLDSLQLIWHNQTLHLESFCKLKVVRVESCEKLLAIVPSNTQGHLTFHNLEILEVKNCSSMKSLFPASTATCLMQLKELLIYSCGLEKIVSEEEVNGAPIFLFPQLTCIHLLNLQELKCFYPRLHAVEWPMLKFLAVHGCKNINLYASEFPSFQAIDGERQPALFC